MSFKGRDPNLGLDTQVELLWARMDEYVRRTDDHGARLRQCESLGLMQGESLKSIHDSKRDQQAAIVELANKSATIEFRVTRNVLVFIAAIIAAAVGCIELIKGIVK